MRRRVAVALACLGLMTIALPARAAPEDLANKISSEVMSPFCPGVTLHDCPSSEATEYRDKIVGWARGGWSEDRIMERIRSDFGPVVNATPPTEGAGIVAWLLPALAVLLGGIAATVAVRRWASRRPPAAGDEPVAVAMGGDERRRLNAELKAIRRET